MKKFLVLYLLLTTCTCFANKIYVNPLATGSNNGTSWVNAYINLKRGIELTKAGDTVLVAEGVYKNLTASGLFAYKFYQPLVLLGGYPNTGNPTDAQRDWVNHPAILDGESGPNGAPDYLLYLPNLTTPAVIDGFVMRKSGRTGLYIENATAVTIKNTLFENNSWQTIYITNSQVNFINCVMTNNTGTVVTNYANANTTLYNCVIANNDNNPNTIIANTIAVMAIYNSTMVNNKGRMITCSGSGSTTVKNSIIWNNLRDDKLAETDIQSYNHAVVVSHSITQTWYNSNTPPLLVNQHPRFLNQLQPAGPDNKFFTADDGLQLTAPCSPALNSGDNSLITSITSDILGNARVYNGGTVDLGAYEMQQTPGAWLTTVYVNSSTGNTGTHDGSSWAKAFPTLQQALLYCADTIKIAAGTYLTTNSYRDSAFSIEPGKVVLGGYPATGNPTDADRNPKLYQTILKGNYPGNSTYNYSPVIKIYNSSSTTELDGIRATNWNSNQSSLTAIDIQFGSKVKITSCDFRLDAANDIRGTQLYINDSCTVMINKCEFNTGSSEAGGGAITIGKKSNVTITACNFSGYTGAQTGTVAIYALYSSLFIDSSVFWKNNHEADVLYIRSTASVLGISNCLFRATNNREVLFRNTGNTTGTINNCIFRNYYAANYDTAAVYNDNSHLIFNKCLFDSCRLVMRNKNYSSPVLNNCVSANSQFMWNQRSSPTLNNCTIVNTWFPPNDENNRTREELVRNEDSTVFRANNTIFWPAKLNADRYDILDRQYAGAPQLNSISILTNCLTQKYGTHGQNGNIVGKAPRFKRPDYILGPDGKLLTTDDGLQLAVCSPAVNAGNTIAGTILPTDILNNPRIVQSVPDMGAYELQVPADTAGVYYVNSSATGTQTGLSWNNAYTDLQTALCNSCADTIRVAAGIYKPALTARDSSFVINRPLALFGSYPATGNPAAWDRNVVKHPTILSGNIGDLTDSLDNTGVVVLVNGVTDSVHIDGFVIRDGYSASGGIGLNASGGSGMNILYTNTGIYNCHFINNNAAYYGGGLYIGSPSRATVNRCIFTNNYATNYGGAIYSSGYLRLNGSVIENNHSFGQGGGISMQAGFDISNSVFYRNYTTAPNVNGVGGGLYAGVYVGRGTVTNCSFVENKATYPGISDMPGGGFYFTEPLIMKIRNCIFSGNIAAGYNNNWGADLNWANYNITFNCILQYARSPYATADLNIAAAPGFKAANAPKGADGIWLTKDDGLQLHYASAAINHGLNAGVTDLPVDILNNARIIQDTVDAGAYEYQNQPEAIAGTDTTICAGTTVQIGSDANPKHTYNWTSNPAGFTSGSVAPVVNPTVATTYYVEVSNGTETARDTITVDMSGSLSPAVNVVTAGTTVCANAPAIFTATPVFGGSDPSYEWQVNGVKAGTDTTVFTTPVKDGDQVSVHLTSNASCASPATATSNVIKMNVTPVSIPQVTINGPLTFCAGDTVTYTATAVDGGTRPLYKWYKGSNLAATGYANTYTTSGVTSSTSIVAMMYSTAVCLTKPGDTSNTLSIVPRQLVTPSVVVTASKTAICGPQQITFTAQGYNSGANPLWQWKVNGNNVGANSNTYTGNTFGNGDNVYVAMTSNETCLTIPVAESNKVSITHTIETTPVITISAKTEVPKDSMINVEASVLYWNGSNQYQWYDSTDTHGWQVIAGATSRILNYMPRKTGDAVRCNLLTYTNCGSVARVQSAPLTFKVNTVTGIDVVPAEAYGITSWPNPVNTLLVIDGLKPVDQWQTLEITNVEGRQKILSQNITAQTRVTINTAQLKAGLYIVMLKKKNGEMVYIKFVKI